MADGWTRRGKVVAVAPNAATVRLPGAMRGALIEVERGRADAALLEVHSLEGELARCVPVSGLLGVVAGAPATCSLTRLGAFVGPTILGCVVDAWGRGGARPRSVAASLDGPGLTVGERLPVRAALATGVAALDALLTLGRGQRVALIAGSGVGKTMLLQRIAERADADAKVVALVGERGREAAETIGRLREGPGWAATTVVCATADASPRERLGAAQSATAHAEALCTTGRDVLLVVDSLTRVAAAWRELALAAGEAPAFRGYPASLVGVLAGLVERAGPRAVGRITAIYSVLVDGDDPFEPVTDCLRSLLDGHVTLSRSLADAGRYPPIDVLRSTSRTMPAVTGERQQRDAALVRRAIATLERAEDLIAVGAYRGGADPWLDTCVAARSSIEALIFDAQARVPDPVGALASIAETLRCGGE